MHIHPPIRTIATGGQPERLALRLTMPDTISEGEFVVATLELGNDTAMPMRVSGQRLLDGGDLWVKISQPERNDALILGRHGFQRSGATVELAPGARLRWGLNLSWSEAGATFESTGRHVVRAIYDAGTGPIESNHHTLTVVPQWLRGYGPPDLMTRTDAGRALFQAEECFSDRGSRALESYRDTVGTGTLLCQLALLAAALHRSRTADTAQARSRFMLDHAIARFGAEEIAVLITALFPYSGHVRKALCGAFERALAGSDADAAANARAIVRGEAFPAREKLRALPPATPVHVTRH